MTLFDRLIDDARLIGPDRRLDSADLRSGDEPVGPVGRLVVPDHQLNRISGMVPAGMAVPVSVLNTSGAGGLVALARRQLPGLVLEAAESALRDLDDLAGSAARVVAAAQDLDPETKIFVQIPHAPGWLRAVQVVEAAGQLAKLDLGGVAPAVAADQLSALVEADLGFKVTGLPDDQLLPVVVTVAALIDGAAPGEVAGLLRAGPGQHVDLVAGWDEQRHVRVRRRLRRWDSTDPGSLLDNLRATGVPEALLSRA